MDEECLSNREESQLEIAEDWIYGPRSPEVKKSEKFLKAFLNHGLLLVSAFR